MRKKRRDAWWSLGLVLAAVSCSTSDAGVHLELLAGGIDGYGNADGVGTAARFATPAGVAVDGAGNVYVADRGNATIRRVTADGVVTTLAGTAGMPGSADGTGTAARFRSLIGVAIDSAGAAYVADAGNETIRKITTAGVVTTLAGTPGMRGSTDGTGADARFGSTGSVAVDGAGNVYVADSRNATIRRVTAGGVVTTLAGTAAKFGSADGAGADARFDEPVGVAVDSAGNAYVADQANATIRKVTPEGVVTTLAGTARMGGSADGTGAAARFGLLGGVAVDSAGNAYATDEAYATIRKVTANGVATTLAGTAGMFGSADGTGAAARFGSPFGVAVDSAGNVDVSDFNNATIRKITAAGVVTTLAGTPFMSGDADGTGSAARFRRPLGMAADSAGNVYVADAGNFIIRKVTATGVVTTLAGTAGMRGSADGTGAAARFSNPAGLAADAAGNIYVADPGNHAIRKVTPMGVTTTIAGTPALAEVVLGATAGLAFPQSLAIVDDSIVIIDGDAILVLRHGARQ